MVDEEFDSLRARYKDSLNLGVSLYLDSDQWEDLAFSYELDMDLDTAIEVIENGLRLHQDNCALLFQKARYLLMLERMDEAIQITVQLPSVTEEMIMLKLQIAFLTDNNQEALLMASKQLEVEDISVSGCCTTLDFIAQYAGFEQAEIFAKRATKLLRKNEELLREFALLCEEYREFQKGETVLNELLDRNPYSWNDWLSLSKLYALRKEYDRAIEACDFALACDDVDPEVLIFKGYCYYDATQYLQAIDVMLEYAELVVEEQPMVFQLIAECYMNLNQNEIALQWIGKALELDASNAFLYYQKGANLFDLQRFDECEETLRISLSYDNNDIETHLFLAEVLFEKESYEEAIEHLKIFLEQPSNADSEEDALVLLGNIYSLMEEDEEAIIYYKRAVELNPIGVKTMLKLVVLYFAIDNEEEAFGLLDRLIVTIDTLDNEETRTSFDEENLSELEEVKGLLAHLRKLLNYDNNLEENNGK